MSGRAEDKWTIRITKEDRKSQTQRIFTRHKFRLVTVILLAILLPFGLPVNFIFRAP